MITTPSMGLKRWDQPNDIFSYVGLSDNFSRIDAHDHSTGKGVQIPTDGIVNNAVDSTKLANNAVTVAKIPLNTITGDRLLNSTLADTKLASPNNTVWRTLQTADGFGGGLVAATIYAFTGNGGFAPSAIGQSASPVIFPWVASHYTVAGKSTKLRVLGVVSTNATAPASSIVLAWNPVTASGGGSGQISITLGAAVTGSGVTATTPGASTRTTLVGAEFTPPADGYYSLAITPSATYAANSIVLVNAILQVRHV